MENVVATATVFILAVEGVRKKDIYFNKKCF